MTSLRHQKMISGRGFKALHRRILAEPYISHAQKMDLLRELEQYGRKAVPDVARKFKECKKKRVSAGGGE